MGEVLKETKEPKVATTRKEKPIHLNFFQLYLDNTTNPSVNAEEIRKAFLSKPEKFSSQRRDDDESRISLLDNKLVHDQHDMVYGTLINTLFKDLPLEGNLEDESFTESQMEQGKGLGYDVSFLFDKVTNIVMIESARNGVGIGSFCTFFELNLGLSSLQSSVVRSNNKYLPAIYNKLDKSGHNLFIHHSFKI